MENKTHAKFANASGLELPPMCGRLRNVELKPNDAPPLPAPVRTRELEGA